MRTFFFILIISIVSFFYSTTNAQVLVNDTAFAHVICSQYPALMTAGCTTLDTNTMNTSVIDSIIAYNRGTIKNIDEIVYFKNLSVIALSANKISTIPDLSFLKNLKILDIGENPFTSLPDLSTSINLVNLIIRYSNITELKGIEKLSKLEVLLLDHSSLKTIPDLSQCVKLKSVDFSYNYLSFQDLIPLTFMPGINTSFTIFPQKNLTADTLINVFQFNQLKLKFPFDESISGLTYKWYRNDTLIKTTSTNELLIDVVQASDAGKYHVVVTSSNPLLSGSIRSGLWHVHVDLVCNEIVDYSFTKEISCDKIDVALHTIEVSNTSKLFYSYLVNQQTKKKINLITDSLVNITPGTYNLMVTDSNYCAITKDAALTVNYSGDCDSYFTPDGDGVDDTWLIKGTGTVNIIDITGTIVNTFVAPTTWDGTDKNNRILPDGKYAIIYNNSNQIIKISLLKF